MADALMRAVEEEEKKFEEEEEQVLPMSTSGNWRGKREQNRAEPVVIAVTAKVESSCCCIA